MLSKDELDGYCREYYSYIFNFCYSRLRNTEDAEDATQETFVAFSKKAHLLDSRHIKAWLATTAHYIILNEYRRRSQVAERDSDLKDEVKELSRKITTFEEGLVDCYIEKYVDEIYEKLNDREKMLFDLYSSGNMKTGEIAEIMGLEPHACSMRKKRLVEKCREIMIEILFY